VTEPEANRALVVKAFDTLFNQRDYVAAETFWSPGYVQHSAHIGPGRDGLFDLIKSAPSTLRYDHQLVVADGDFVILHGRFSGRGDQPNWIAADIVRVDGGLLVEHWDVLQDEATQAQSISGLPMFGDTFPTR
jgi:predicted SnoaL-like aldol condensation-catalyzing enzyme